MLGKTFQKHLKCKQNFTDTTHCASSPFIHHQPDHFSDEIWMETIKIPGFCAGPCQAQSMISPRPAAEVWYAVKPMTLHRAHGDPSGLATNGYTRYVFTGSSVTHIYLRNRNIVYTKLLKMNLYDLHCFTNLRGGAKGRWGHISQQLFALILFQYRTFPSP